MYPLHAVEGVLVVPVQEMRQWKWQKVKKTNSYETTTADQHLAWKRLSIMNGILQMFMRF